MTSLATASQAGRSIGAMIFSAFGGAWLALWACAEFRQPVLPLAVIALATAGLFLHALGAFRQHKPALAAVERTPEKKRRDRWFHIVNAAQWIVIVIAANVLARSGLGRFVVPMVIVVVGLHFLPLAWLFSNRAHYLTGALMAAWPLVYMPVRGPGSSLGPLGAGLILWGSALWAVRPSLRPSLE